MYAKDVFESPLTRTGTMQQAKWAATLFVTLVIVVIIRIQVGVMFSFPFEFLILNITFAFLYLEALMTVFRKYIFKEKERIEDNVAMLSASSLERYSTLDLKADVASTYKYTQAVYIPEVNGFSTVFIRFTHYSQLEDPEPNQELFRFLFNYCMKNELLLDRYDMNMTGDFQSLQYMSDRIGKSDLPPESLRRASHRLEHYRTICTNARVTSEVVRITSTNTLTNLKFLEHVKLILNNLNKMGSSYTIEICDRGAITDFLRDYNRLEMLGLPELANANIKLGLAKGIVLQKDIYEDGTEEVYRKLTIPNTKLKKIGGNR